MVKHIVFWNLAENAEGNDKLTNASIIKQRLEGLVGVIDGLICAEVGTNFNKIGHDVALYSEFKDKESLEAYQVHPEHSKIREFVHKVVIARAVADYEI